MLILSIDGGGIRGIYPAFILKRIKEEYGIDFNTKFDLISGTSTGSIIAAAITTEFPIEKICELYQTYGNDIFQVQLRGMYGLIYSKYNKANLRKHLLNVFGEKKMKDTKGNLLIPCTDIGNAIPFVVKTPYDKSFVRDKEFLIREVVEASCSAPSYFDPTQMGTYLLSDGGLWANNPALVSVVEAIKRFKVPLSEIKILSIGTGMGKQYYSPSTSRVLGWGLLAKWKSARLVNTFMNLQSKSAENMVSLMVEPNKLLRLNFEETNALPLDDTRTINSLISKADMMFTAKSSTIKDFLEI